MAKEGAVRKELFTILGEFKDVETNGTIETRFVPNSTKHFRTASRRAPKNKLIAATFYQAVSARSRNQVAYHFVLLGYLADYTGYSVDELHDAVMKLVFGTKTVRLNGLDIEIRKSLSNAANLPKYEAVELIEYDLKLCKQMGIKVPTKAELGYIDDK